MKKVLVLLSTYNGQKYLREQLESLYNQQGVYLHLLVRDDGSKDDTMKILKEYRSKFEEMTIIEGANIGCIKSFFSLIQEASTRYAEYDYYAFCDQDDVWESDKLIAAVSKLEGLSSTTKLYFSSTKLVDAYLNPIASKKIRVNNSIGANIASSRCIGCTMVFDKFLLKKASAILPFAFKCKTSYLPLHDCWTAMVAYVYGSVIYDDCPRILYRQHGGNVVGATGSLFAKWKTLLGDFMASKKERSSNCKLFMTVYGKENINSNASIVVASSLYDTSIANTMKFAFTPSLYHFNFIENLGLFFLIITRKF